MEIRRAGLPALRWTTVEDPDAIRAILGALAGSEELVGRAPPFVPAVLRQNVICRADVAFEVI